MLAHAVSGRENVMQSKPFVVLVGMDFSEPAAHALREALELSREHEGAELHVACIVPEPATKSRHPLLQDQWIVAESAIIEGVFVSLRSRLRAEIEAAPNLREQAAPTRVVPHVRVDAPGLGMVQLAADIAADVIVVGANGQGNAQGPLGSAAATTVLRAPCPVVVVRSDKPRRAES
jgi:nucleotide-binding universal stress UspA family protein